ncbi:MAG: hypothetical protein JNK07_08740 [Alphaproteobacteria bacterium]|nr:hypothetical protein [Alphaproteobacteria bacterium]
MANVSDSSGSPAALGRLADRWLIFIAALVYAAGVTVCVALSTTSAMSGGGIAPGDATYMVFAFAGITFFWIVCSAVGFVLLAGLLDVLTERRPQPLSALSIALAGFATFEALEYPLLMIAMRIGLSLSS